MDYCGGSPFARSYRRGKRSGKHDKRKYYEERIIGRRTNQDCAESGRRLGNVRFEKSTVPTKCSGCNRRTCQTICGTTPHRQGQPSGDYR